MKRIEEYKKVYEEVSTELDGEVIIIGIALSYYLRMFLLLNSAMSQRK